jgi:hypothetical protein
MQVLQRIYFLGKKKKRKKGLMSSYFKGKIIILEVMLNGSKDRPPYISPPFK